MYCTMGIQLSPPHTITAAELAVSAVYSIGIEKMFVNSCRIVLQSLYTVCILGQGLTH